ncbi:MAG: DUF5615 family PIN-like protein [Nitrospiraceae bacterium]|nr:DUF5615 family PIN-like protein [Nitrospiraceae bacterium]
MKFIADAMLGRLARRLRLLGYDTAYERDITDAALLQWALKEGRTLLTRDTGLAARKVLPGGQSFLVTPDDPASQLREVLEHFSLPTPPPGGHLIGRCTVCNAALVPVADKQAIKDLVPEHVFLNKREFFRCAGCGRVYWEGSHIEKFKKLMDDIMKKRAR